MSSLARALFSANQEYWKPSGWAALYSAHNSCSHVGPSKLSVHRFPVGLRSPLGYGNGLPTPEELLLQQAVVQPIGEGHPSPRAAAFSRYRRTVVRGSPVAKLTAEDRVRLQK